MTPYYKIRQTLLQNGTAILLQSATKVYDKKALGVLLQNATVITNCIDFATKFVGAKEDLIEQLVVDKCI